MTATVLEFRRPTHGPAPLLRTHLPQLTIVESPAWWSCPNWCDPDLCHGGDTFLYSNGNRNVTTRQHIGTVHAEDVPDVDGFTTRVAVELKAGEDITEGFLGGVVVSVTFDQLETTDLDAVRRFAVALESAVLLAAEPLHSRAVSA